MRPMVAGVCNEQSGLMRQSEIKPLDRDGVGPSCTVLPVGEWVSVVEFLAQHFQNVDRSEWLARIQNGAVLDSHGNQISLSTPYRPHAKIYYYRSLKTEAVVPFEATVLYQDDYLVVADKPHFLPVTPAGRYLQQTLLVRLKRQLGIDTLAPVHRIDRETAGLVLFATQAAMRGCYHELFSQHRVQKIYQAIAPWRADLALPMVYRSRLERGRNFMQMEEVAGTPNAETAIELLEVKGNLARYALRPLTGRKHQLRAQMNILGLPILNDGIYPSHLAEATGDSEDFSRPLQLLAQSLEFVDPIDGQLRRFESQLRLDF